MDLADALPSGGRTLSLPDTLDVTEVEALLEATVPGDATGLRDRALLEQIAVQGSITRAAKAAGLSYKAAWDAIDELNNLAERPLVERSVGGKGGGGARLSADALYTEVNLAIDWNEDVHLPEPTARRIEQLLRARGYNAVRSSVHVNFWPGRFDKLSACRHVVRALGGLERRLVPRQRCWIADGWDQLCRQ